MWDLLKNIEMGDVADFLGIISFPFAVFELLTIKSRMKKAEESMKELIVLKDYQTISELLNKVSRMLEDLSKIRTNSKNRGFDENIIINQCKNLLTEFNQCIVKSP